MSIPAADSTRRAFANSSKPPEIVNVVADAGSHQIEPADGAQQLPERIDLEEVHEGVVLEDHGQARVGPEQCRPDVGPCPGQAPKGDAHRGLAGHADLEVGRAIAGVDDLEPLEEPVAELLRHPFPADEGAHPV